MAGALAVLSGRAEANTHDRQRVLGRPPQRVLQLLGGRMKDLRSALDGPWHKHMARDRRAARKGWRGDGPIWCSVIAWGLTRTAPSLQAAAMREPSCDIAMAKISVPTDLRMGATAGQRPQRRAARRSADGVGAPLKRARTPAMATTEGSLEAMDELHPRWACSCHVARALCARPGIDRSGRRSRHAALGVASRAAAGTLHSQALPRESVLVHLQSWTGGLSPLTRAVVPGLAEARLARRTLEANIGFVFVRDLGLESACLAASPTNARS